AMLLMAVLTLPPEELLLLSLYYFDSMPLADIALMMDTTPQKLSKRLYNIRRKLYNRIKRR
ncbi:MAG: sigma factor-like helix-turn-helix DNA-binding protein, partial [Bacteroidales bacterium]|nr:sigma factor-like helix-turn-helix DNA-binding protein [Bacteroidales bacterium]